MQEAIKDIAKLWGSPSDTPTYSQIFKVLENKLEKEKEQIINAFEVGYKSCDLDEAFEINRKLASGELYYNQTYNQD